MKQDFIITAKTVEEAMAQAVEKYGSSDVEISYRIIDMPKKGFLGIGATPAKVLVTVGSDDEVELLKSELRSAVRSTAFSLDKTPEPPKAEQKKPDLRESRKSRQQDAQGDAKQAPVKPAADKPAAPAAKQTQPAAAAKAPQAGAPIPVPKPLPTAGTPAPAQTAKPAAAPASALQSAPFSDLREYRPSLERKKTAQNGDAVQRADAQRPPREQKNDRPPKNDRQRQPRPEAPRSEAQRSEAKRPAAQKPAPKQTSKPHRRDDDVFDVSPAEMTAALDFINKLLCNMELACTASPAVPLEERQPAKAKADAAAPSDDTAAERPFLDPSRIINITGVDAASLIGYHGETLDALQYLVNLAVNRREGERHREYVKIIIDIENYRAKREETLRALARRNAARALKYRRNISLEPMNPYERRIIHSEVQLIEGVSTHSVGSDENRRVIMTVDALGDTDSGEVREEAPKKRSGRSYNRRRRSPEASVTADVTAVSDAQ